MMEGINLEQYKSAWKTESSFSEEKFSRDQMMKFMQASSKNISGLIKKSLITDLILKSLLLVSFGLLFLFYANQTRILLLIAFLILVTSFCILVQTRIYRKIPLVKQGQPNIKTLLHSYIDFYTDSFKSSLIVTAFSTSLFIISGYLFYFYNQYGRVRPLQFEDYLVFGSLIIIGFLLSAFIQIKNFNFHMAQLQITLDDIENETLNERKLKHYKKLNNRNLLIFIVILLCGMILLSIFLFML
jgi:hypothetical protein